MATTMPDAAQQPPQHPYWLLRRRDQTAVAALVVVALLATVGWWIAHGGWSGRLIEVDKAEPSVARFEVDVNTADWPELTQLPGVGTKLAKRIIESRQSDGPFAGPDDLLRINGIGRKKLEQIRPYLRPVQQNPNATP
jgi:competence protein ComEA